MEAEVGLWRTGIVLAFLNSGIRENSWEFYGQPRKQTNGSANKSTHSSYFRHKYSGSNYPTSDALCKDLTPKRNFPNAGKDCKGGWLSYRGNGRIVGRPERPGSSWKEYYNIYSIRSGGGKMTWWQVIKQFQYFIYLFWESGSHKYHHGNYKRPLSILSIPPSPKKWKSRILVKLLMSFSAFW